MKNLIIREASNKDAESILALIFNIWIYEYQFKLKKEDFPDLNDIEKYYNTKDDNLFLIALVNDQIIGTCACSKLSSKNYVLKRMFVNKSFRGQGVSQVLLNKLFDKIVLSKQERDIKFFLSTKEDQALAAKNLYLKNGFRRVTKSELPSNFPFFYEDDLFMLKDTWAQ